LTTDWVSSPIVLCAITGAGLLGSLALWITARIEIGAVRNEFSGSRTAFDDRVAELSRSLDQLKTDRDTETASPIPALNRSLNLTKRSQIVRMYRRGETEASISAALQAPRNEVELVLKLDRMLNPVRQQEAPESRG